MKRWYLTFGQTSPLKDGWICIEAQNEIDARALAIEQYGKKWGFLYEEGEFEPGFFPQGELGILK